jgi:D-serine deaminase-like pyridoxal phosphate-dependent protein
MRKPLHERLHDKTTELIKAQKDVIKKSRQGKTIETKEKYIREFWEIQHSITTLLMLRSDGSC